MNNKKQYYPPRVAVENFVPNEYVATCWLLSCSTTDAEDYEKKHNTWVWQNETKPVHGASACGSFGSYTINDVAGTMKEYSQDQNKWFDCTVYSDEYVTQVSLNDISVNKKFYWTTGSGNRIWHHQGIVSQKDANHPNAS